MTLDLNTREKLGEYIEEDLFGAVITSATIYVDEHGWIELEELILRRQDGKEISVGLEPGQAKITLAVYDSPQERRAWTVGGWRKMSVEKDYTDDLEELTAPPWNPRCDPDWEDI